jgi:hypothetical protein
MDTVVLLLSVVGTVVLLLEETGLVMGRLRDALGSSCLPDLVRVGDPSLDSLRLRSHPFNCASVNFLHSIVITLKVVVIPLPLALAHCFVSPSLVGAYLWEDHLSRSGSLTLIFGLLDLGLLLYPKLGFDIVQLLLRRNLRDT